MYESKQVATCSFQHFTGKMSHTSETPEIDVWSGYEGSRLLTLIRWQKYKCNALSKNEASHRNHFEISSNNFIFYMRTIVHGFFWKCTPLLFSKNFRGFPSYHRKKSRGIFRRIYITVLMYKKKKIKKTYHSMKFGNGWCELVPFCLKWSRWSYLGVGI